MLRVGYHGLVDMTPLDPNTATFTAAYQIFREIFDPLLIIRAEGRLVGGAAKSWAIGDEGRSVTFELREDARWSDGQPVRAADFREGFENFFKNSTEGLGSNWLGLLGLEDWLDGNAETISGLEMPDDHTLKFLYRNAADLQLASFASSKAVPLPSHLPITKNKPWGAQPEYVSNGPYFIAEDGADGIKLGVNPYYPDAMLPEITEVLYAPPTVDETMKYYLDDELDIVLDVSTKQIGWASKYLSEEFYERPDINSIYLALNANTEELGDVRVRRALNLSMERSEDIRAALGGAGLPLYGMIPPHTERSPFVVEEPSRPERLAEATALLADAGYHSGSPLKLRLGYYDIQPFEALTYATVERWKDVGVEVELTKMDGPFADLIEAFSNSEFDITIFTNHLRDDDIILKSLRRVSNSGFWNGFYTNVEIDALLAKIVAETDIDTQTELALAAQQMLLEQSPVIQVGWWKSGSLVKPTLRGLSDALINGELHSRYLSWQDPKC